jgi:outer membrane murein-binding lipoprotein Lpp
VTDGGSRTLPGGAAVREAILEGALETRDFVWLIFDADGRLETCAALVRELVGSDGNATLESVFAEAEASWLRELLGSRPAVTEERLLNLCAPNGERRSIVARVDALPPLVVSGHFARADEDRLTDEVHRLNNEMAVLTRRYQQQARELEAALADRDRSYWHLEKIQEVLPVCMDCHTIKPGSDWTNVVDYLAANEIALSHGLCPTCEKRRLQELDQR